MAKSGFKMKGSPFQRNFGIGGSPMRDGTPWYKSAWDKATQVGMGIKGYMKASDRNTQKGIASRSLESPWDAGKKAYNKERIADEKKRDAENKETGTERP